MSDASYSPAAADLALSMEAPSIPGEELMAIGVDAVRLSMGTTKVKFCSSPNEDAAALAASAANLYMEFGDGIEGAVVDYVERSVAATAAVTLAATIAANDAALVIAPTDESLLWLETVLDTL